MSKRFPLIDQIRGFAIVLMIIFHFFYDLKIFGYNNINFNKDFFWFELPRLIVFLFLLSMGLSLPLVHKKKINWKKFWPRWIKIALGAIAITAYTFFMFKKSWVYFGTLHCIATASLVSLPFIRIPRISGVIGIIMVLLHLFFRITIPWFELSHPSMDYIPLFPWIGCVFIGFGLWSLKFHELNPFKSKFFKPLEKMGQHSLIIYLIHQPILYGLVMAFTYFYKK